MVYNTLRPSVGLLTLGLCFASIQGQHASDGGAMPGMRVVSSRRHDGMRLPPAPPSSSDFPNSMNRPNERMSAALRLPSRDYSAPILFPNLYPMRGQPAAAAVARDGVGAVELPRNEEEEGFMELPGDMDMENMNATMDDMVLMSNMETLEDFVRTFGMVMPEPDNFTISTRFSGTDVPARMATRAMCQPEEKTVELDLPLELNVVYFPRCVRLMRCGGCCTGPLLSCQPNVTTPVKLEILRVEKTQKRDGRPGTVRSSRTRTSSRRTISRRRRVSETPQYHTIDEVDHATCTCQCRVKEQDCNPALHTYMQDECQCRCNNNDEKKKCLGLRSTHYWDSTTCSCYCIKHETCGTGLFYDHSSCRCKTNPAFLRGGNRNNLRSRTSGPFVPDDPNSPAANEVERRRREPERVFFGST